MARRPHRSPDGPSSQGFGRSVAAPPDTGVWEIDSRPIAARVQADDGSWYEPTVLLVVEASGLVRAIQPEHPHARLAALPEVITSAIEAPPPGCRRGLPSRVVVGDPQLLERLTPLLPGVPLRQGSTPLLDEALQALAQTLTAEDLAEGLGDGAAAHPDDDAPWNTYLSGEATSAQVGRFFEAAAALHQGLRWEQFPREGHLFRVTCSALGMRQWLGFVVNSDGDAPAVVLFRSEDDYWVYEQMSDRAAARGVFDEDTWPCHISFHFASADQLTQPMLEEIRRHGWAVACAEAYPQVMVAEPDRSFSAPSALLLQQLEAVAGALLQWSGDATDLSTRWILRQQPRRFQVALVEREVRVSIGAFAGPSRAAMAKQCAAAGPSGTPLDLRVAEMLQHLDACCSAHLNDDYRSLLHRAVTALAAQQPSPLLKGYAASWCAGLVHAIGTANFLFERTQTPHCTIKTIQAVFGVSSSVVYAHSKKARELLQIEPLAKRWTLAAFQQPSADPQLVQVNGMTIDIRKLPSHAQWQLCGAALASLARHSR